MATGITLPEISNEMRELAKQAVSKSRIEALNIKLPTIDQVTKNKAKQLSQVLEHRAQKNHVAVDELLNKTVRNSAWKFKQSQLIKGLNKTLEVDDQVKPSVSGHRLYLFVSSSIPKTKMRQYAKDLVKYPNAQMVMRGFIGGAKKMQPTMAYIKSIIVKNESCINISCKNYNTKINIDPVLFNRYGINKVPTLVYVDELSGGGYCSEGNTDIVNAQGVHRFTGLAPLKYMIRELAEATKLTKLEQLYQSNYESNNQ
ncbi:hypothetical protein CRYPA_1752 [uncultured Candidatus Thioglobus sp.]|nr:hypothetical protein CRYPA_1752 [uncultured Candidatus Thioglobus sp.]